MHFGSVIAEGNPVEIQRKPRSPSRVPGGVVGP